MAGIGKYKGEGSFSMNSPLNADTNAGYAPFKMRGSPMQRNFGIGMQTLAGGSPAKAFFLLPLIAKAAAVAGKVGAAVAKGAAVAGKAVAGAAKGAAGLAKGAAKGIAGAAKGAAKGVAKGVSKVVSKGGIKGAVQKQTGKFASKISGGQVTKGSQLFTKEGIKGVAKTQGKKLIKDLPQKAMQSMQQSSQKQQAESERATGIGKQTAQTFAQTKFTTGGSEEKTAAPTGEDDPTTPFAMKGFSGFGNSPAKAPFTRSTLATQGVDVGGGRFSVSGAFAPKTMSTMQSGLGTRSKSTETLRSEASKKTSLLRPPGMQWLMGKDKPTSGYGQRK